MGRSAIRAALRGRDLLGFSVEGGSVCCLAQERRRADPRVSGVAGRGPPDPGEARLLLTFVGLVRQGLVVSSLAFRSLTNFLTTVIVFFFPPTHAYVVVC